MPKAVDSKKYKKYLRFRPYIDPMSLKPYRPPDRGYYYKMYNGGHIRLISFLLEDNGFREVSKRDQEFTLLWATSNIKSHVYQGLGRY